MIKVTNYETVLYDIMEAYLNQALIQLQSGKPLDAIISLAKVKDTEDAISTLIRVLKKVKKH